MALASIFPRRVGAVGGASLRPPLVAPFNPLYRLLVLSPCCIDVELIHHACRIRVQRWLIRCISVLLWTKRHLDGRSALARRLVLQGLNVSFKVGILGEHEVAASEQTEQFLVFHLVLLPLETFEILLLGVLLVLNLLQVHLSVLLE